MIKKIKVKPVKDDRVSDDYKFDTVKKDKDYTENFRRLQEDKFIAVKLEPDNDEFAKEFADKLSELSNMPIYFGKLNTLWLFSFESDDGVVLKKSVNRSQVQDDSGEEQYDRGVQAGRQALEKGWTKEQTKSYYSELQKQFMLGVERGFKEVKDSKRFSRIKDSSDLREYGEKVDDLLGEDNNSLLKALLAEGIDILNIEEDGKSVVIVFESENESSVASEAFEKLKNSCKDLGLVYHKISSFGPGGRQKAIYLTPENVSDSTIIRRKTRRVNDSDEKAVIEFVKDYEGDNYYEEELENARKIQKFMKVPLKTAVNFMYGPEYDDWDLASCEKFEKRLREEFPDVFTEDIDWGGHEPVDLLLKVIEEKK